MNPGLTMSGAPAASRRPDGFTMIELMIVIAIIALTLSVGVPAMFRVAGKDSLRATTTGIMDACHFARAQAILTGTTQDLVIRPRDGTFTAPGMTETVTIPQRIRVDELSVNFVDVREWPEVHVRFFPNSTCDEFTIVLNAERNEYRKISLETVTSRAELESDPHRFIR
jgi:prepilin-type N-terminal cleavage/methylation domain-containing protein